MKNWRTTLGGSVSTVGKGLIAMTVLPQLAGNHEPVLWYLSLAGYIINIIGEGLSKLWAADAKVLNQVVEQTNAIATQTNVNTVQIADTKKAVEDQTDFIKKG